MPIYDVRVQAPKDLCKWCNAHLGKNKYTGQYVLIRNGDCTHCQNTGDHNYRHNGRLVLTHYVVDQYEVV